MKLEQSHGPFGVDHAVCGGEPTVVPRAAQHPRHAQDALQEPE